MGSLPPPSRVASRSLGGQRGGGGLQRGRGGGSSGDRMAGARFLEAAPYSPPAWARALRAPPAQRLSLARLPTPVAPWPVGGAGGRLFVKRDDLSGMQLSGNKVRKLEFLLADALARGCDTVVTVGGAQSNHCRATATAARYLGLEPHLVLRSPGAAVDDPGLAGNLLVDRLVGAHVHQVTKVEYQRAGSEALTAAVADRLRAEGRKPYVIPVGGSNALGAWGYLEAVRELEPDVRALGITDIALATGSGGTAAGLALGARLAGLDCRVRAYAVCDSPAYFFDHIQHCLDELGAGVGGLGLSARDLLEVVDAKGAGYAQSREAELETLLRVARDTGVVLDPVYSGKAVHGLLGDLAGEDASGGGAAAASPPGGRRWLFLHTGGLLGLYDKVDQLQPLVERLGAAVGRAPSPPGGVGAPPASGHRGKME